MMVRLWGDRRLGLVVFLGLAIAGCPGTSPPGSDPGGENPAGEDNPGATGTRNVATQVHLPAGVGGDPAALTVSTALGGGNPSGSGDITLKAFAAGPQLVTVTDPSGHLLGLSWITASRHEVTARTTAEVLLSLKIGLYDLPTGIRGFLLDQLAIAPEVEALASAIAEALAADPGALANANASWVTTLNNVAQALTEVRKEESGSRLKINPPAPFSGVGVEEEGVDQIKIRNIYGRRFFARVEKMYDIDQQDAEHGDQKTIREAEIGPARQVTEESGFVHEMRNTFGLHDFPKKQESTLVPTPKDPEDAKEVVYRVRAFGPGASAGIEDVLSNEEREKIRQSEIRFLILDLFAPPMVTVLLSGNTDGLEAHGVGINEDQLVGAIQPMLDSDILGSIEEHNYQAAAEELMLLLQNNSTLRRQAVAAVVQSLPAEIGNELDIPAAEGIVKQALLDNVHFGTDTHERLVRLMIDFANRVEQFEIKIAGARVRLEPDDMELGRADSNKVIRAIVTAPGGNPDAVLSFNWHLTAQNTRIWYPPDDFNHGDFGDTFNDVPEDHMSVWKWGNTEGEDTISVEVYDVTNGKPGTLVGKASAPIKVTVNEIQITPRKDSLRPGKSSTFTLKFPQSLEDTLTGKMLRYSWKTSGAHGTFANGATEFVSDTSKSVDYVARTVGSDTISGEVLQYFEEINDWVRVANTAQASVKVELTKKLFNQPGAWGWESNYSEDPSGNGWSSGLGIFFRFKPIANATSYKVRFYGFIDGALGGKTETSVYEWANPAPGDDGKPTGALPNGWRMGGPDSEEGIAPEDADPDQTGYIIIGYAGGVGFGYGPGPGRPPVDMGYVGRIAGAIAEIEVTLED